MIDSAGSGHQTGLNPGVESVALPLRANLNLQVENGDLAAGVAVCIRLDLEDLPCFTQVDRQYEAWGVLFKNAVAIRPSNPAFPPRSGVMLLHGAPDSGWIEATFLRPVQYVSSFITSSRLTVMSAFDCHNQLIAQIASPDANFQGSAYCPNLRLSVNAANIHRITLYSFNGQLTIDEFCFCL